MFKVIGETEQVYYENTTRHTMASTCYNISLRPAVVFKNCLPVDVVCCTQNSIEENVVKPGDIFQMPNIDPGQSSIVLKVPNFI